MCRVVQSDWRMLTLSMMASTTSWMVLSENEWHSGNILLNPWKRSFTQLEIRRRFSMSLPQQISRDIHVFKKKDKSRHAVNLLLKVVFIAAKAADTCECE